MTLATAIITIKDHIYTNNKNKNCNSGNQAGSRQQEVRNHNPWKPTRRKSTKLWGGSEVNNML